MTSQGVRPKTPPPGPPAPKPVPPPGAKMDDQFMPASPVDMAEIDAAINSFEECATELRHFEIDRHPEGECRSCDSTDRKLTRMRDDARQALRDLFVKASGR